MKSYYLFAALALAAGCASNSDTTVDATNTGANSGLETSQVVPGSQADLEQTAGHQVFFGYDQHDLSAQAQSVLRKQADWLMANPGVRVQLAGNCDERGTREYNLALGARRSNAAKEFLVGLGVDPARLVTVSNGKEKPGAFGSTEAAWSENRNATTTIVGVSS